MQKIKANQFQQCGHKLKIPLPSRTIKKISAGVGVTCIKYDPVSGSLFGTIPNQLRAPAYIDQLVSRVFSINYNKWRKPTQHPRNTRKFQQHHFHLFD